MRALLALAAVLVLTGCASEPEGTDYSAMIADLEATCGSEVVGTEPVEVKQHHPYGSTTYFQTSAGREFYFQPDPGSDYFVCHGDTKPAMGGTWTYNATTGEYQP